MELLLRLAVVAVSHLQLAEVEMGQRVILFVANSILIGGDSLAGEMYATVTVGHFQCTLSFQGPLFVWRLGVGLLVLYGGIVVLSQCVELVTFLHSLISPTADEQQGRNGNRYDGV